MKSIRDVYKIGKGPSSSHTMGPERAAKIFLERYPDAASYCVRLYASLSKTGRGHGTDRVLYEVLGKGKTEVQFCDYSKEPLPHPNTLDFFALDEDGNGIGKMRVLSIGGGISNEGDSLLETAAAILSSRARRSRRRMTCTRKTPSPKSISFAPGGTLRSANMWS